MDNFLTNLLFPKFCLGCNKEGNYLCQDCRHLLDICEFDFCLCEQNPSHILPYSNLGKCKKCSDRKLAGLYFALTYKENKLAQKLVRGFKYQPYLKDLAPVLASILAEHFIKTNKNTNEIWQDSVLVPVPLHPKKFRERGYNQSEELAKELAKILKIPCLTDVLIKTEQTASQMELKREDRQKNLLGAFAIHPSCHSRAQPRRDGESRRESGNPVSNKKIFLVDDVYTTGSTMSECAKVLRSVGAKSVWGIALAREG